VNGGCESAAECPACVSIGRNKRGSMRGGGLVRSGGQPEMGPHTETLREHLGNHKLSGDMHQNQAEHGEFLLLL